MARLKYVEEGKVITMTGGEEELKADEVLRREIGDGKKMNTSEHSEIRTIRRQRVLPFFFNRFTVVAGWIVYLLLVFSFPYIFQYFSQKKSVPISLNFTLFKKKLSAIDPFASKQNISSPSSAHISNIFPTANINNHTSQSIVNMFHDLSAIIMIPFKILKFILVEIPRMLLKEICDHRIFDANEPDRAMNINVEL